MSSTVPPIDPGTMPLLRFLAGLNWLENLQAALARGEHRPIELAALRRKAPCAPGEGHGATLVLVLPADESREHDTVLLAVRLAPRTGEVIRRVLAPVAAAPLMVSREIFSCAGVLMGSDGEHNARRIQELANRPWSGTAQASWTGFWDELEQRALALFGVGLAPLSARLEQRALAPVHALIVDDALLGTHAPLCLPEGVASVLAQEGDGVSGAGLAKAPRDKFLGRMVLAGAPARQGHQAEPALAPALRLVALEAAALAAQPGRCMLGVNMAQSVVKTGMWQAVLASRWVQSALDQAPSPPLTMGVGPTNRSLGQLMDVFSGITPDEGSGVQVRWLDGLPTYGWFLPSSKAAQDLPGQMQLDWSADAQAPLAAHADAVQFVQLTLDEHRATYLRRARAALGLCNPQGTEVGQVLNVLHAKMVELAGKMRQEQDAFAKQVNQMPALWRQAARKAGPSTTLSKQFARQAAQLIRFDERALNIKGAIRQGRDYQAMVQKAQQGWRAWLSPSLREKIWKNQHAQLRAQVKVGKACFERVSAVWHEDMPGLNRELSRLELMVSKGGAPLKNRQALQLRTEALRRDLDEMWGARCARRGAYKALRTMVLGQEAKAGAAGLSERAVLRCVREMAADDAARQAQARDLLWHHFDTCQDEAFRLELFHLAARYWEGRWVQAQTQDGPALGAQAALGRWMMLGAMVVSSMPKLFTFESQVTFDLLVLQDVEQCLPQSALPDLALRVLAMTRSAVFVGETRQPRPFALQPRASAGLAIAG